MYSNMNKKGSSMILSLLMLLWATTTTTTIFVAGQRKESLTLRMKALRKKKCGKCQQPDMKALALLAKDEQFADTFNSLYSSSDFAVLKTEITSVYESDISSGKDDDDELVAAIIALFTSSQKNVQTSLQQVERQGPISAILAIGTILLTVIGTLTAILGLIEPGAEILTGLGTLSIILAIVIGVLNFFSGFLVRGLSASATASEEMTQFQTTFSDISCTAESLQCQVDVMKRQSLFL